MSHGFPIHVEQTQPGEYLLSWTEEFTSAAVQVRAHSSAAHVQNSTPLLHTDQRSVRVSGLPHQRHYFYLQPETGEGVLAAERALALEEGTNFRDMGGYRTDDGRRVRWGKLYRSGHTSRLTERDTATVAGLDIRVCCDFRRAEESQIETNRLPPTTRIVSVAIDPGSHSGFFDDAESVAAGSRDMVSFMHLVNREFVLSHAAQYSRMFEELLNLDDGGFMINCAAGKDRTGFGAAVILAALGVSQQTIFADYLLSERYYPIDRELARVLRKYGKPDSGHADVLRFRPMMETHIGYLQAAFDTIAANYVTVDRYLAQALGVGDSERRALRQRLTA